ncbi:DUF4267 domain-containing protein [Cytophaga aurantiaca]|uniref:DUF4267 domain-containing protein n=1 Tax=Cytophaga aurantiaca TaxID=29530 RepID=UPI00035FAF43|nr:DUF4267 domain-containing protein [Cytophaga aurantiaca]
MKNPKGLKNAQYLCLFPGIFLIVSGSMLLLTAEAAQVIFDLQDLDSTLALAMGIRQLAMGVIIVMLALTRQLKALGLVMIIGAIVPITDFFIFSPIIGWVSALRHALAVPVILGLGFYLLHPLNHHHE